MMPAAAVVRGATAATVSLVLRAQQVIQNVDNSCYIPFGLAVGVLEGRVQGARECARVHALAVVVHGLNDGAPVAAATRGAAC